MTEFFDVARASSFSWFLLGWALRGAVVLLVALVMTAMLRRRSAAARHLVWSLALFGLIFGPALSLIVPAWPVGWPGPAVTASATAAGSPLPSPIEHPQADDPVSIDDGARVAEPLMESGGARRPVSDGSQTVASVASVEGADAPVESPAALSLTPAAGPEPGFVRWPASVWLVGTLTCLLVPMLGTLQLGRLRRGAARVEGARFLTLLGSVQRDLRIRRRVQLVVTDQAAMPMTWGLRRPIVLLPADYESWSDSRLRMVLLHELAHLKRWDWTTQMMCHLGAALHWFNPLVWYAARRMQIDREQACDDLVLQAGAEPRTYAAELLHFACVFRNRQARTATAVCMARQSSLEQRIRGVLDGERRRGAVSRRLVLASVGTATAVLLPLAALRAGDDVERIAVEREFNSVNQTARPDGERGGAPNRQNEAGVDQPGARESSAAAGGATKPPPTRASEEKFVIAQQPGTWLLPGGARLEVSEVKDERLGTVTRAVIRWPATEVLPAVRHSFDIASAEYHTKWAAAWVPKGSTMWILVKGKYRSRSSIRVVDFTSPAGIVTWTEYGDDHFDLGLPEVGGVVNARRAHYSLSAPGQAVPKVLNDPLVEIFKAADLLPDGIGGLLPRGPYMAGGQRIETAVTEERWRIAGTIRDPGGEPLSGVEVRATTQFHPTVVIDRATTDADGRYSLEFPMDLHTLATWRGLMVRPEAEGVVEAGIARSGEFDLFVTSGEDTRSITRLVADNYYTRYSSRLGPSSKRSGREPLPRFSDQAAVLGQTAPADFVMAPAAQISGVIVDAEGRPHPKAYVSMRLADQRKGYSVSGTGADERGRFQLKNVLIGTPLEVHANPFQRPSLNGMLEGVTLDKPGNYLLRLQMVTNNGTTSLRVLQLESW